MSESDLETISLHASKEPRSAGGPSAESPTRLKMPRPYLVALFSILILFLGWGTWRYLSSMKLMDDSEGLTDLDGIEAVTPLFEPDATGDESKMATDGASSVSASKGKIHGVSSRGVNKESLSGNRPTGQADVWLTGTIEVDNDDERIELPQRISGSPNESFNLR